MKMKTNYALSVAVIALLGAAYGKQQQQSATSLMNHNNYQSVVATLVQQKQKVVESAPPVQVAHVQLQSHQQIQKSPKKNDLVATAANDVIYTKSHLGGSKVKLDKDTNDKHTTLTIVQEFPKQLPDMNQAHNVEMVQAQEQAGVVQKTNQTSQIKSKIQANVKNQQKGTVEMNHKVEQKQAAKAKDFHMPDEKDAKRTTLTIVQEFRKKVADKPPTNDEMIQQKEKETVIANEKVDKFSTKKNKKDKLTTLTIVQEFPKKKVNQEVDKPPSSFALINHNQEINMLPNHENKIQGHQSLFVRAFTSSTNFLYDAFGFGNSSHSHHK